MGTFPEAQIVIGQSNFDEGGNDGTAPTPLDRLRAPRGNPALTGDGTLFVAEHGDLRGFVDYDTQNGPNAALSIQASPSHVSIHGGRLVYIRGSKVKVFNGLPTDSETPADVEIGSEEPDCSPDRLRNPLAAFITPMGKLIVADTDNNRVLIWNQLPTQGDAGEPNSVIGQSLMDSCAPNSGEIVPSAQTLSGPTSVWSDDQRLVVVDKGNHRVLIWNTFPGSDNPPAFRVLGQLHFGVGQPNFGLSAPNSRTLSSPHAVDVRTPGFQIAVADSGNNRLMLWNNFPVESFQFASQVVGQATFTRGAANDRDQDGGSDDAPSSQTMRKPEGVRFDDRNLIVVDRDNHRVLVFRARN